MKKIYILRVFDEMQYKFFVLTKVRKKGWRWISLNKNKAGDGYVSSLLIPKWKAIRWARVIGEIIELHIDR